MGPRSYERGISTDRLCVDLDPQASMGPRSYERGIIRGHIATGSVDAASMGPRSYERGIEQYGDALIEIDRLQWGRVLTNAES